MRNIKKYFSFALLIMLAIQHNTIHAQETELLSKKVEHYSTSHLEEKLFLHTDKSVYLSDEICWFKIYNVDGAFHLPLAMSTVAYVEILDNRYKAIVQEKVTLQNGLGTGSIKLPNNIGSGTYTLRAYTNWMKNYSADFFFQKTVTIINTKKDQTNALATATKEEIKIQVYPEGGNLVNDLPNKVAFKITNQYGKGIASSAIIINEQSETITKASTLQLGMGNFSITPKEGQSYKISIQLADGRKVSEALPKSNNKGYTLKLTQAENQKGTLNIAIATKNITSSIVYLIGHTRGVVKTANKLTIENGIANISIPNSSLGNGINSFTLFDENRNPVCERLYFKYPEEKLGLSIATDAREYAVRNKVSVKLNSFLVSGKGTNADLSMAVYKVDELQPIDETNIQNYLWLSSDLIGKVESPNSYFNEADPQRFEAMDNLMLINGWRRFNWEIVLNDKKPAFEFLPEIAGKIVTGRVVPNKDNLPINGITAYLSMPSKRTQFRSSMSDQNGKLKFQFNDFFNDDQVIAQIEKNNAANYKIEISNPFVKSTTNSSTDFLPYTNDEKFQINRYHRDLEVQNYYNQDMVNKFESNSIDTSAFYHKADERYLLDDYSRFNTLEEVFREYMTNVKLNKSGENYNIAVYDNVQKRFFSNQPLILLDGYPITDLNKFMSFDPLKIRKLEIVDRMYFLGNMTYYGVMNFTTYTGKMEGYDLDPQAVVLDFKGLQSQREFITPDYAVKDQVNTRLPDFRHLLFWSADVNTNEKGKNELSFFTSDVPGKYVIVVQGLNQEGKTGYQEMTFEVTDRK
jgi:hypothetical protein